MASSEGTPRPALISVRQTTPESKWAGAACPRCNNPIQAGEQAVLCPKCYTPHHLTCWMENDKRCAIDQTPANVLDRSVQRPAAGAATAGAARPAPPAAPAAAGAVS